MSQNLVNARAGGKGARRSFAALDITRAPAGAQMLPPVGAVLGRGAAAGRLAAGGLGDFGCEVVFFLVDALTQSIAHEPGNFDRCAQAFLGLLQHLLNGSLAVTPGA